MLFSRTSSSLLMLLGAGQLIHGRQCYYPDGTKSLDYPCNANADTSVCCGTGIGFACLENGLCKEPAGAEVRGSCTSADWPAEGCPNFCTGRDRVSTYNNVVSCNNVTHDDKSFCCEQNAGCCDSGLARFILEPPRARSTALWDDRLVRFTLVPEFASLSTAVPSSPTGASPNSPPASTTTSPTSPTGSTQNGSQGSSASGGLDMGAKIGIGVGIGIGVILVACCVYIIYRLHARSKEQKKLPAEVSGSSFSESTTTYYNPQQAEHRYRSPAPSELPPSSHHPNAWSAQKSERAELN